MATRAELEAIKAVMETSLDSVSNVYMHNYILDGKSGEDWKSFVVEIPGGVSGLDWLELKNLESNLWKIDVSLEEIGVITDEDNKYFGCMEIWVI